MKVRIKIIGSFGLMILIVSGILVFFALMSAGEIQQLGRVLHSELNLHVEDNIRQEFTDLAESISHYVVSIEQEIDRNMLNAAKLLYEVDRISGGRLTLADLERLKKETGMSDLYLAGMNGVFTLSTEPGAAGVSLFEIWDGYRMLVTGESNYLPSDLKIKVETGEIFKFTAIPRADNRGIIESALEAGVIEEHLQNFISTGKGIRSINLFDFTMLTLTGNQVKGIKPVYTKGNYIPSAGNEVADLFKDPSKISLTMNDQGARVYYPVIIGDRIHYVLFIDIDTKDYYTMSRLIEAPIASLIERISFINRIILITIFSLLLVFTVLISIMINRLLRPLGFFNTMLASFADGNFSLAVPGNLLNRKDEMGEISKSFENTLSHMKNLIVVIKEQSQSLQTIGDELSANMTQTAEAVNKITAHIRDLTEQSRKQADGVNDNGNAADQIMEIVEQLDEHVTRQSDAVVKSSQSIDNMLKNIRLVGDTLEKNNSNIAILTNSSEVGRRDLQKVSEDLKEIASESEGILAINSVMENIASQTNLLSMNAAIEAAHAGESGKGFAVVAGEIRKLAESSSQQSKTTAEMLKKIKSSVDAINKSMAVVFERFESIEQEINTVSNQETSIRNMMMDQEKGSQEVLEAITELNSTTDKVKDGSGIVAVKSRDMTNESSNLSDITASISEGMYEMALGAEEINSAISRVNEISGQNKQSINTLSVEITKFKV